MGSRKPEAVLRGQMYYANLNPVIGSEQGGKRPVLIVQNNMGNKFSPTVVVAPITTREKRNYLPTHVIVPQMSGLPARSQVLLEQIRTIDKSRLQNYIGCLDDEVMDYIDRALGISVGLDNSNSPEDEIPDEMVLCLCPTCANQFLNSPDHIIRRVDPFQEKMDDCTYCSVRRGYDYRVILKSKQK